MASPTGLPPHNTVPITYYAHAKEPILNDMEREFLKKIISMDPNTMLDRGKEQEKCRALGQQVFNYFKNCPGGSSLRGKTALCNVYFALEFHCDDGRLRQQLVMWAWRGVGDSAEKWSI